MFSASQCSVKSIATNRGGLINDTDKENSVIFNVIACDNPLILISPSSSGMVRRPNTNKFMDIIDFTTNLIQFIPIDTSDMATNEFNIENSISQFIKINQVDDSPSNIFTAAGNETKLCEVAQLNRITQTVICTEDSFYLFSFLGYKTVNSQSENLPLGDTERNQITFEFKDDNDNLITFKKPYNFKLRLFDAFNF